MAKTHPSPLVPRNPQVLLACVIATAAIDSVVGQHHESCHCVLNLICSQLVGYDSSLMGSLNVMPSYQNYFTLSTATKGLNTSIAYTGGCTGSLVSGWLVDWRGRRESIILSAILSLIGGVI